MPEELTIQELKDIRVILYAFNLHGIAYPGKSPDIEYLHNKVERIIQQSTPEPITHIHPGCVLAWAK